MDSDNDDIIDNRPTTAEMALYEMVAEDTSDVDLQRADTAFVKLVDDMNDNRGASALDKNGGRTTALSEVKEVKKEPSMREILKQLA